MRSTHEFFFLNVKTKLKPILAIKLQCCKEQIYMEKRWDRKCFVRIFWWDDLFSVCFLFIFVLLRYHSHTIKFTLFPTSDFNFVHFAFLYFSRFQGQTCRTLVIIKKGNIFKMSFITEDVGQSILISVACWEILIFLVKKYLKNCLAFGKMSHKFSPPFRGC